MMRLLLAAVGRRPPSWVAQACEDYRKRLPSPLAPQLLEIAPSPKHAQAPAAAKDEEAARIRAAVPERARLVVLDERGEAWTTRELAAHWQQWQQDARDVALVIGGANGCADSLKAAAAAQWSLSRLTLPHMLVRVIVFEQLYRAWSLLANHPYHRD
jgi:23S rRNA (pseudouridine1915-N3)-methyltransferase